jgi:hypothetical protein
MTCENSPDPLLPVDQEEIETTFSGSDLLTVRGNVTMAARPRPYSSRVSPARFPEPSDLLTDSAVDTLAAEVGQIWYGHGPSR